MNSAVAVKRSAHIFSGLVQVHEDEGRSGVISVSRGSRRVMNRCDDDKATERLTLFQ